MGGAPLRVMKGSVMFLNFAKAVGVSSDVIEGQLQADALSGRTDLVRACPAACK